LKQGPGAVAVSFRSSRLATTPRRNGCWNGHRSPLWATLCRITGDERRGEGSVCGMMVDPQRRRGEGRATAETGEQTSSFARCKRAVPARLPEKNIWAAPRGFTAGDGACQRNSAPRQACTKSAITCTMHPENCGQEMGAGELPRPICEWLWSRLGIIVAGNRLDPGMEIRFHAQAFGLSAACRSLCWCLRWWPTRFGLHFRYSPA